jgi:nitrogen-specific signal transduction histidine kinase
MLRKSLIPRVSRTEQVRAGDIAVAARPATGTSAATVLAELPYDWLFAAASEAVLLVEAATETITAANPAAATVLTTTRSALIGTRLLKAVDPSSVSMLERTLASVRKVGSDQSISLRARRDGGQLDAKISLLRSSDTSYLLVRLRSSRASCPAQGHHSTSLVLDFLEEAPVGFLIADGDFRVEYANRTFIAMADGGCLENLRYKSLQRWLDITERDSARLHAQMSQRQAVTVLASRLRSELGALRQVQLRAVAVPDDESPFWGFFICERPELN